MSRAARLPVLRIALPMGCVLVLVAGWLSTPNIAVPDLRDPPALLWNLAWLVMGGASPVFLAINLMRRREGDTRGTGWAIALWAVVLLGAGLPVLLGLLFVGGGVAAGGAN